MQVGLVSVSAPGISRDMQARSSTRADGKQVRQAVTWEYSAAGGSISDLAGNLLANVAAQTAINYIGSQFYFNDFNASGHLVSIGA